jgi:hypothetical protein
MTRPERVRFSSALRPLCESSKRPLCVRFSSGSDFQKRPVLSVRLLLRSKAAKRTRPVSQIRTVRQMRPIVERARHCTALRPSGLRAQRVGRT